MDKELIKQAAISSGQDKKLVKMSIDFYTQFIVDTISSGSLENVRIPLFGTFQVNLSKIRYMTQIDVLPKSKLIRRQGHKPVPKKYKI